jgi:hypothetical protein
VAFGGLEAATRFIRTRLMELYKEHSPAAPQNSAALSAIEKDRIPLPVGVVSGGVFALPVRCQYFPKRDDLRDAATAAVEGAMADLHASSLCAGAAPLTAEGDGRVHLANHPRGLLLSVLRVQGTVYVGFSLPGDGLFFQHMASKTSAFEDSVCRAYFKVHEVGCRTGIYDQLTARFGIAHAFDPSASSGSTASDAASALAAAAASNHSSALASDAAALPYAAMDVGASPGGWSRFFASTLRFQRVFAIDTGDLVQGVGPEEAAAMEKARESDSALPMPLPLLPPSITHLRMIGQDAVPFLAGPAYDRDRMTQLQDDPNAPPPTGATGPVSWCGRVALYGCDANVCTPLAWRIFKDTARAGLLAPGAVVIITFKNFDGPGGLFLRNIRAIQRAAIEEGWALPAAELSAAFQCKGLLPGGAIASATESATGSVVSGSGECDADDSDGEGQDEGSAAAGNKRPRKPSKGPKSDDAAFVPIIGSREILAIFGDGKGEPYSAEKHRFDQGCWLLPLMANGQIEHTLVFAYSGKCKA